MAVYFKTVWLPWKFRNLKGDKHFFTGATIDLINQSLK